MNEIWYRNTHLNLRKTVQIPRIINTHSKYSKYHIEQTNDQYKNAVNTTISISLIQSINMKIFLEIFAILVCVASLPVEDSGRVDSPKVREARSVINDPSKIWVDAKVFYVFNGTVSELDMKSFSIKSKIIFKTQLKTKEH